LELEEEELLLLAKEKEVRMVIHHLLVQQLPQLVVVAAADKVKLKDNQEDLVVVMLEVLVLRVELVFHRKVIPVLVL
jgi:hypothetical protein